MTNHIEEKDHHKNKKLALKFLKEHKTAVIATASRQGEPQASTIFYGIDDDLNFSFITDNKSRKWANLKENPHVALVVGTGPDVMTVQCGGHIEIIDYLKDTDRAEKIIRNVLERSKLGGEPPALPVLMNPSVELGIFTLKPEWMVLLNLEIPTGGEKYSNEYIKVLP